MTSPGTGVWSPVVCAPVGEAVGVPVGEGVVRRVLGGAPVVFGEVVGGVLLVSSGVGWGLGLDGRSMVGVPTEGVAGADVGSGRTQR